ARVVRPSIRHGAERRPLGPQHANPQEQQGGQFRTSLVKPGFHDAPLIHDGDGRLPGCKQGPATGPPHPCAVISKPLAPPSDATAIRGSFPNPLPGRSAAFAHTTSPSVTGAHPQPKWAPRSWRLNPGSSQVPSPSPAASKPVVHVQRLLASHEAG